MKATNQLLILVILFSSFTSCARNNSNTQKENITTIENMNQSNLDTITLAGGCFWCTEAVYQQLKGVISVTSGYTGGKISNPTYREVCSGLTGHAECVNIVFDKSQTSIKDILEVFFTVHDPTTLNRQGADVGTQYRSGIFYHNDEQKTTAVQIIDALNKSGAYSDPIVTEVTPYSAFYMAEDYHQNYYNQNGSEGYCQMVIRPKVEKFRKVFHDKLK